MQKNEWIYEAIAESLNHENIVANIHQEPPGILMKDAIIDVKPFYLSLLRQDKENNSETALILLLRPILLEYGFQLLTVRDYTRNIYIFLLINQQSNNLFERLEQALQQVYSNNSDPLFHNEIQWISFGKAVTNYEQLSKSYDTALATLHYQQNINVLKKPFYDSLTFYRLINLMRDKEDVKEIISDSLGPILKYDQERGTELLKRLQVYLEHLGAKNETAEALHIVRQTLYHRLNRIELLLGEIFMIEFSIHALKYVEL